MNINPIHLQNLSSIPEYFNLFDVMKTKTSPYFFKVNHKQNDLESGYILETLGDKSFNEPNVWIYFDHENACRLFKAYKMNNFHSGLIAQYNSVNPSKTSSLSLSEYYDTWPNHKNYACYNVLNVFETCINLKQFTTLQDFIDFYLEKHLDEL